jgi:integrase
MRAQETLGFQTYAIVVNKQELANRERGESAREVAWEFLLQRYRKTVSVLAMILDHAGITPNPARDKLTARMPREERRHVEPPTAEHVEAVVRLLPSRYRLPTLVLDATGMRVGELEALTWGDLDEPRGRWRVPMSASKTGRARWIEAPSDLFAAVVELVSRDDRHADRRVFDYMTADRLRTGDREGVSGCGSTCVFTARPTAPPRVATPPCRDAVGAGR